MSGREALAAAWTAIGRNLLRSLLAALGIVIAVAAVVATVTAGDGARSQVERSMAELGTNLVYVFPGSSKSRGAARGAGSGHPLNLADGQAIARELMPWVAHAAPVVRSGVQAVAGGENWATTVLGTTAAYLEVRPGKVAEGRFLVPSDEVAASKVCVLGYSVAEKLFGAAPAVGARMRLGAMPCLVVGVMALKGQSGFGQDQDDAVFVPFATATKRLTGPPGGRLTWLLSARSAALAGPMEAQVGRLLRQRHRLAKGAPNDFSLFNMRQMQDTANAQMRTLTAVLGAVAIISLVVGAIGVANVMLVSVTERTREVGLRLAVGARRRDVRRQFLVEAVLLSAMGGALGVALGAALSFGIARYGGWPWLLQPGVAALAVLGAGGVGVLAGFYPAWRASRLDPIEALRYE